MALFEGAGVALVTPFKENGEVNYEKLEEIVEEQIAGGTLIVYEGKCHNRTKNKANPARIVRQDSPFRLQNVVFCLFILK